MIDTPCLVDKKMVRCLAHSRASNSLRLEPGFIDTLLASIKDWRSPFDASLNCTILSAINSPGLGCLPLLRTDAEKGITEKGVRSRTKKIECLLRTLTRPLRLEFLNALYHVTSRRNAAQHKGRRIALIAFLRGAVQFDFR